MTSSIEPVLSGVLTAVATILDGAGRLPGRVYLAPGSDVAWDACCGAEDQAGGQLYLRVDNIWPSGMPFPEQLRKPMPCAVPMLAVSVSVGIVRCAHTLDDYGNPPSSEDLTGDALALLEDATLIWEALQTLKGAVPGVATVQLGQWTPEGPMGGCASGEWAFTLGVTGLCWRAE